MYIIFRQWYCTLTRLRYNSMNVTFICTGKPKTPVICLIAIFGYWGGLRPNLSWHYGMPVDGRNELQKPTNSMTPF